MKDVITKLVAAMKGLGLPEDKQAEAEKALEESMKTISAPPKSESGDPRIDELARIVGSLQEQNAGLLKALNDEKKAREEGVKHLQEQAKAQRTKEIGEKLDKAVAEGRITPKDREKWQGRLEKDFETSSELLGDLPPNPALARENGKGKGSKKEDGKSNGNGSSSAPANDYLANRANYLEAAKAELATSSTN